MLDRPAVSQVLAHHCPFHGVGWTTEHQPADVINFLVVVCFDTNTLRQGSRRVVGQRAVQEGKRLRRDRRDGPLRAARVGVGPVEDLEERVSQVAPTKT